MAHVGKFYPVAVKNRVAYEVGIFTRSFPPRCLKFRQNAFNTPVGTAAVQWAGLSLVSDPGDYDATDSRFTLWMFQHPTNATLSIEVRLYWDPAYSINGFGQFQCWSGDFRHVESGIIIAKQIITLESEIGFFQGLDNYYGRGPDWTFEYFPAKQSHFVCEFGAARWDQQPSYHPYRH